MIFQVVEGIAKAAIKEALKEGIKTGAKTIAKEGLKKGIKAGVKAGIEKGGKVILEKGEKAISKAAKKLKGDWISDITGKIYRNTTRAKAEQYEKASERMRKDPSKYAGWTKEGREKADMGDIGIDVGDVVESQSLNVNKKDLTAEMEKYSTDEDSTIKDLNDLAKKRGKKLEDFMKEIGKILEYIKYENLPSELISIIHNDNISTDDHVKGEAIEALASEGWDGINVEFLRDDMSNVLANFELLEELSKYY